MLINTFDGDAPSKEQIVAEFTGTLKPEHMSAIPCQFDWTNQTDFVKSVRSRRSGMGHRNRVTFELWFGAQGIDTAPEWLKDQVMRKIWS